MVQVELTPSEIERYDRQMSIPGWGIDGQRKLKKAKVVVCGAGGLGCPASMYLAAAGIGHLVIIDKETIELSNLNRQVLHWQPDVGKYKAVSIQEKLKKLNPDIKVEAVKKEITEGNIHDLIRGATVVVDAMDNFTTRFIINRGCVEEKIPFIHAGIYGFEGSMATIIPGEGPCLRCIYPSKPPEAAKFPVLGATPGVLAVLETVEAFKLIIGLGRPLVGRLLVFDGLNMSFTFIELRRDPTCPVCSKL